METAKQKEQSKENGKSSKSKIVNGAANIITAAGIGAASYAYGQSRTTEQEDDTQDSTAHDVAADNGIKPQEDEQMQNDEVQSVEEATDDTTTDDVITGPEPIASTDGIDFVVQVDDENNIVSTDTNEPTDIVLPEPEIPISGVAVVDEVGISVDDSDVAINDNPDDFIGNDIQQDLLA